MVKLTTNLLFTQARFCISVGCNKPSCTIILPSRLLNTAVTSFVFPYQSDWQAIRGALVGCLALLHRKQGVGCIVFADVKRLVESFLQNVQVQSLAAADRKVDLILQYKDA
jgi:DNA repair/transcription protein MET18/MMS19